MNGFPLPYHSRRKLAQLPELQLTLFGATL